MSHILMLPLATVVAIQEIKHSVALALLVFQLAVLRELLPLLLLIVETILIKESVLVEQEIQQPEE